MHISIALASRGIHKIDVADHRIFKQTIRAEDVEARSTQLRNGLLTSASIFVVSKYNIHNTIISNAYNKSFN